MSASGSLDYSSKVALMFTALKSYNGNIYGMSRRSPKPRPGKNKASNAD